MKNQNLKLAAALALCLAVRASLADSSVSYTGGAYTQNFDSLATYSSTTGLWTSNTTPPESIEALASPIAPVLIGTTVGAPIDLTGPSQDFFASIPALSTMNGWAAVNYSGNSNPLNYNVSNGSSNTPALTAFFDPGNQAAGTPNNMALGAVTASATGYVTFGVKFINNSTASLNAISLSYIGELFHQDTNAKSLAFGYLVTSASGGLDVLVPSATSSTTTGYGALNIGDFATGAAGVANATQSYSVSNLSLASVWAPGQALWLTWTMASGGGGQGLGIDNLSFSAANVAGLPTLVWDHAGDGAWNTTDANWTGASTVFANGNYNVSFGNTNANATITVDAGGVSVPNAVTITNNGTGAYTFAGGPISGSAALNIAGSGTVILTAPNTYGGGTNLNGGVLVVSDDGQLGVNSGALNFSTGTLQLAANITGTRQMNVLASGGAIDLAGHNATFGTSSATVPVLHGELHVTGAGNLNLGIQPTFGSNGGTGHLRIDAGTTVTLLGNSRGNATQFWDGGIVDGTLVLDTGDTVGGARFNFNSAGITTVVGNTMTHSGANGTSILSGTGEIQIPWGSQWVVASNGKGQFSDNTTTTGNIRAGVIISNTSGANGGAIDVAIHLNNLEGTPGHPAFNRTDVTNPHAYDGTVAPAGNFVTIIGGTKNNGSGKGGIGPNFAEIIISGVISGDSDLSVGNDYKSGGSGNVLLAAQNTYHGVTMLNGGGQGTPVLYLGVDNALPTDTDLVFGSLSGAGAPSLDLNGFNQTVQSLSIGQQASSPQLNQINNSGPTPATLTISGAVTPYFSYNGQINDQGPTATDVLGQNFTAYGGSTTALVKDGPSTLVLGQYLDNQSGGHFTLSSYSGGTTVKGGTLQIPFDGALGAPAGALTFDGGTVSVVTPDLKYDLEQSVTWTSARPISVTASGGTVSTPSFTAYDNNSISHSLVASVVFTGANGYNWGGNLSFTGAPGSSITLTGAGPVTVNPGAAISIANTVSLTLDGNTDPATDSAHNTQHVNFVNNGSLQINGANKTLGTVTGAGTLTQSGPGTTTIANYQATGPLNVAAGTLAFSPTAGARHTSAVLLQASAASVATGTTLDLTNYDLLIHNANPAQIESLIGNAYNFGLWNHPGITSSAAQANPITTLAIMSGADYNLYSPTPGTFDGAPVASTDTIIKYTYAGDLNLDGLVNDDDFGLFSGAYFFTHTGNYAAGDLNFDGLVNDDDFGVFSGNYFFPPASPLSDLSQLSPLEIENQKSKIENPLTSVPEPTSLLLLALGTTSLLRHKRRP